MDNTLNADDSDLSVNLEFNSLDDFDPAKVVNQVEPLKQLMAARNKLKDLLSKADRSDELEALLEEVLQNTDKIASISDEIGKDEGDK